MSVKKHACARKATDELILDEKKRAFHSSYLDFTLVTTSSVYDYYASVPSKDIEWQELEDLRRIQKIKKSKERKTSSKR